MRKKEVSKTSIVKRDDYIHIETDLGIVNIYPGLYDDKGRKVTTVQLLPDRTEDHKIIVSGGRFIQLKKKRR